MGIVGELLVSYGGVVNLYNIQKNGTELIIAIIHFTIYR